MGFSDSCDTNFDTNSCSIIFKNEEFEKLEETGLDYSKLKEMCTELENVIDEFTESSIFEHEAAVKLQKVYKSFRTRRKLADCAVQLEQNLWNLLHYVELKRSSVSFFSFEKEETAFSRWSRARTMAAKVGMGLSKNNKAQKLALQHWLEAIDPRHRYGHNLHLYYGKWLRSQSREPFFYWLDIGEGKEINLVEKCPRSKLQQQCIKYLGPIERKAYEVTMENGMLLYKHTGVYVDTSEGAKWIFVLSTSKILYVGIKKKGSFQHSSFLAGGATLAAGRLVANKGTLKAIWPHSGHYRPTHENFQDFLTFLKENDVDMTHVKMDSDEDKETRSNHIRTHSSSSSLSSSSSSSSLSSEQEEEEDISQRHLPKHIATYPSNGYEVVFHRTSLQKVTNCVQLSCKWSTGTGPRIGSLRDYPMELQSHASEQDNLSPKTAPNSLLFTNPTRPFSFQNRSLLQSPCRIQPTLISIGAF